MRGGSTPSSRSWSEVRLKRASQVGNFEAWERRPRPITVRKVCTSGMKGVGEGIGSGGALALLEERRFCWSAVWIGEIG